ncbi:MAG: PD40 domain-containing protein [Deltaproteobacteria bacterium]|nr:PD40 domain-containing protein [Deltaproteobacteria bacterium]
MYLARLILLAVFLGVLGRGAAFCAVLDIPFKFSTIETEHFKIHYHQGLYGLAEKTAYVAEGVYGPLTEEFMWSPAEKTHIVLVDDSDFLHAYATVIPFNAIYIQAAPPEPGSAFDAGDWLTPVIVHEYAHILSTDTARGYSVFTRRVFGKTMPGAGPFTLLMFLATAPPNNFLPGWTREGVASWAEARRSRGGRGRGAYYSMVRRMAVAQENIPTVDRLNGEDPRWPGGQTPYIFGLEMEDYMASAYGSDGPARLNHEHAGRFPYFLNGAPLAVFGKDYITIYKEMTGALKERENEEIKRLTESGLTPVKDLIKGQELTNPRYSPDGKLVAVNRRDPEGHETIVITDSADGHVVDSVRRLPSDRSITWSPDGTRMYFCQEEVNSGFYVYEDLYEYELSAKKTRRLTYGLRVREADLSPDGRLFAVVINSRARQSLALLDAAKNGSADRLAEKVETVRDFSSGMVAGPRWSPDGASIAYTVAEESGGSALFLYGLAEKTHRKLYGGEFAVKSPAWSADGQSILFISDETGVYNIYAYSLRDGRLYRVTNLLGGAFTPDVSKGSTIVFSSYGSNGFSIATLPCGQEDWKEAKTPGAWAPAKKEGERKEVTTGKINISGPRPYSAAATIAPRFWLPTLSRDNDGTVIGAFTAGVDVLEYNAYKAELDWGAASGRLYYDALYLNDYYYPTFTFEARKRPVLYSDFLKKGDYYELNRSYSASVTVPVNSIESNYSFRAGYTWQRQSSITGLGGAKFNGIEVFEGRRSYLFLGAEFTDALKYPLSISREEGRTIGLLYRAYSKAVGSRVNSKEYIASYTQYLAPFPEGSRHDVVFLNVKGGVSAGVTTAQQSFQLGGIHGESDFPLRGFRSRFETGKYAAKGTIEYRSPFGNIYEGWNTKPIFLEKLHGALFVDGGEAWGNGAGFSAGRLKIGAGFEARADITVGYRFKVTPAIGIARGLNHNGKTVLYFTVHSSL